MQTPPLHLPLSGRGALLRAHLDGLVAAGCTRLVIDLRRIGFADAYGLGAVCDSLDQVRDLGGWIRLAHTSARIRRVLRVAGLNQTLPAYRSAIQAFAAARPTPAAH